MPPVPSLKSGILKAEIGLAPWPRQRGSVPEALEFRDDLDAAVLALRFCPGRRAALHRGLAGLDCRNRIDEFRQNLRRATVH